MTIFYKSNKIPALVGLVPSFSYSGGKKWYLQHIYVRKYLCFFLSSLLTFFSFGFSPSLYFCNHQRSDTWFQRHASSTSKVLLCSPLDPSNSCFYVRGPTEKERVVNFFAMPFFFSEHNKVRSCNWCSKTGFADQFKIQQLNLWRSASSSPPPWYLRLTCILIKGRWPKIKLHSLSGSPDFLYVTLKCKWVSSGE